MKQVFCAGLLWSVAGWATGAIAASPVKLTVPAGRLSDAVVTIGEQAGVTIGLDDPTLAAVAVRGVRGRLDVARALDRMLEGTRARAIAVGPDTYRIVARPLAMEKPRKAPAPPVPADAILVTGSKRGLPLEAYPGSVVVTDVRAIPLGDRVHGSEALVNELPILSSTHLGPGRNKLFVRGIADSSFNGPSQSTVGQYLGEARLNYNAPDPDLALYDIASVEVLEGPQGTLYGAGALGGIIRLVPVMPDLDRFSAGASLGLSTTRHGADSWDGAGLVNVPFANHRAGLRLLGYRTVDGGYIDDPARGLSDINRTRTVGGRAELRIRPATDWTIDLTVMLQNINSRDGQYAERGLPPLRRESVLSQPFDNDYALGSLVVRHLLGAAELVSTTSIVRHDVTTDYDASLSPAAPRLFNEDDSITLLSNETRVSRRAADGSGWVAGIELLHSADHITRELGPPSALDRISGSRNAVSEAAIFGEATVRFTDRLLATGGGRIGFDAQTGEALDHPDDQPDQHRDTLVFLPSAGLLWKFGDRLSAYVRYQEGYRAGGLSVSDRAVARFRGDSLATVEAGLRLGSAAQRLDATAAVSYAHWEGIQADLVDSNGLPMTANIGNGRVLGFEARAGWRPTAGLALSGSIFLNDSALSDPALGFAGEKDASLPNVADVGAQLRINYERRLGRAGSIAFTASARYVGGSKLGVGPVLSLPQGHYVDTGTGLRWTIRKLSFTLDVRNLLDDGRNQFALGDPFMVAAARQVTPLRPRTVRFGLLTGF